MTTPTLDDTLFSDDPQPTVPAAKPLVTAAAATLTVSADDGLGFDAESDSATGGDTSYTPEELEALGLLEALPRCVVIYGPPKTRKTSNALSVASCHGNAIVVFTDPSLMTGYLEFLKTERAAGRKWAVPMALKPSEKVLAAAAPLSATVGDTEEAKKARAARGAAAKAYAEATLSKPGIKWIALDRGTGIDPCAAFQKAIAQLKNYFAMIERMNLPKHMVVVDEVFQWCLDAENYIRADSLDYLPAENREAERARRWDQYDVAVRKDGALSLNVWGVQAVVDGFTRILTLSLKNDLKTLVFLVTQMREYKVNEAKGGKKAVVKKQGPQLGLQESAPKTAAHETDAIIELGVDFEMAFSKDDVAPAKAFIFTAPTEDSYRGHRFRSDTPAVWSAETVKAGTPYAEYESNLVGLCRFWGLLP